MKIKYRCLVLSAVLAFCGCENSSKLENVNGLKCYNVGSRMEEGAITSFCYYDDNSIATINNYRGEVPHGEFFIFYENGGLKESGAYDNGKPVGVWHGYHPNGNLYYSSYSLSEDSTPYEKYYDNRGNLEGTSLPVSVAFVDEASLPTIGEELAIKIKLEYSEFDNPSIAVFFDQDNNPDTYEDSLLVLGTEALYQVVPTELGRNSVRGTLLEIPLPDDVPRGVMDFEFFYEAY